MLGSSHGQPMLCSHGDANLATDHWIAWTLVVNRIIMHGMALECMRQLGSQGTKCPCAAIFISFLSHRSAAWPRYRKPCWHHCTYGCGRAGESMHMALHIILRQGEQSLSPQTKVLYTTARVPTQTPRSSHLHHRRTSGLPQARDEQDRTHPLFSLAAC
jgi:hypothetical protein